MVGGINGVFVKCLSNFAVCDDPFELFVCMTNQYYDLKFPSNHLLKNRDFKSGTSTCCHRLPEEHILKQTKGVCKKLVTHFCENLGTNRSATNNSKFSVATVNIFNVLNLENTGLCFGCTHTFQEEYFVISFLFGWIAAFIFCCK